MTTYTQQQLGGEVGSVFESTMNHLGLTPRPQQTALVSYILKQGEDGNGVRFVQAGTGTGKSFAVLTTAYQLSQVASEPMWGDDPDDMEPRKLPSVVICPTNNLINQYVDKDAPRVAEATGGKFEYLKGRSHYLCTGSFAWGMQPASVAQAEFNEMVKDGKLEWSEHGLNADFGCSGDCDPDLGDLCAVQLARARAAKADVIVTNAHVMIWDRRVRSFTNDAVGLLPIYGALIVDECHTIDSIARGCLSDSIGWGSKVYDAIPGLRQWVQNQAVSLNERTREVPMTRDDKLESMIDFAMGKASKLDAAIIAAKANWDNDLARHLKKEKKAFDRFLSVAAVDTEAPEGEAPTNISTVTLEPDRHGDLQISVNRINVDCSQLTRAIFNEHPTVLVSGTVPKSLPARLGVKDAPLDDVGTPFDYNRSTLAISRFSAKSADDEWARITEVIGAVNDMAGRSHEDGGGGTLILFTSWKDLNMVMPHIVRGLKHRVPVFAQSNDRKDNEESIEAFKAHGHGVMGGVQSMWTGLDIPGNALRQVIIYRLPWGVPTLEVKAIEARFGRQPYVDQMTQLLTQGIGRLVRTETDNGRVYIADSRARNVNWRTSSLTRHIAGFRAHQRKQ